MDTWIERPTIELDLDQAPEVRFAAIPAEALVASRRLLAAVLQEVPPAARMAADVVRARTSERFQAEAAALGGLVDADWRDVVLANISYDLLLAALGCSTVALETPDGPVLARNMDWWPEHLLAQASYLMPHSRRGAAAFATAGWPGALGVVTGLSARGFALALNAVSGPEGAARQGYPVLLHLRRVLEDAQGFDEAVVLVRDEVLASPALVMLVGLENHQRVVVERSPTRHALRWGESGRPLMATNDYRLLYSPQSRLGIPSLETTCSRYAALERLLASHRPANPIDDRQLLEALTNPSVIQEITAQHIIARPRQGRIRLFVPARLLDAASSN
jgi:hypothetical protein